VARIKAAHARLSPPSKKNEHMAQLQHNMWVTNAKASALSIITGGGKWVEIAIGADSLYQHLLLTAEKKFWRCVENGEPPQPVWRGAAAAPHRGSSQCRHELVQMPGPSLPGCFAGPGRLFSSTRVPRLN
jgi:hypothetical protein